MQYYNGHGIYHATPSHYSNMDHSLLN